MTVLITGSAGFIGFHTCNIFLQKKYKVLGVDNLNSYYSVKLKKKRIDILNKNYGSQFKFIKTDIIDKKKINNIFIKYKPKIVIHLAAQAGVRYSIENPDQYIKSNIVGFFNILDCSRMAKIKLFFYASSSSVYGNNKNFPLSEKYNTDDQLSLYAASKKSNEIIARSYFNIFGFKSVGMRFFTVYGPYGRPDMFMFKLLESMYFNKKLYVYNHADHYRDFTYIDDVVNSIFLLTKSKKINNKSYVVNIGRGSSIGLKKIITYIQELTSKKPNIKYIKMQKGDVKKTHSDLSNLRSLIEYSPKIDYRKGLLLFIDWYKKYKKIN